MLALLGIALGLAVAGGWFLWRAVVAGLLSGWAGERGVQAVLLARLEDEHPLVREKAVRALEPALEAGNAEVGAALEKMLSDPARNVRVAAAWVLRATIDMQSGAGRELEQALGLEADQPTGQYRQAVVLLARQQPAEALSHLRKTVEWDPFSPPLRYQCAMVLSQLGRTTEALEALSRAEKVAPDDPQIVYGRAAILARAGRYEEARAAAKRALEMRRDFQPAGELLQQLRGNP